MAVMFRTPILLTLALALAPANYAATLFVSTEGRAGWSGRLAEPNAESTDGPLPSLAAARDAIRRMRGSGAAEPATVLVRAGVYFLPETLVLGPQDSNTTYAAYKTERPVISGGRPIQGWTREGNLWKAPSGPVFRQFFINGRRAQRARTPNDGFYRIDGPSSQDKPFLLRFRGNDIQKSWEKRGVEVVALLAWSEIRMPIVEVDSASHIARLTGDPRPSNREKDARYWIENAPDGLDAAGEFYVDPGTATVSYRPLTGDDLNRDEVIAPVLVQLVRLEGKPESGQLVRDVVFRGLDFRYADWSIPPAGYADTQAAIEAPSAFEAVGAENVSVEHCSFSQMGGYAIWFGRGSKRNHVVGNEIFDMGGGGVRIGETVLRPAEADQNVENVVSDNHIHNLGAVYPAAVGVWIGQSSRNTVAHNHIHDLYYTAISAGWTWGYGPNQCKGNIIEFNHLHHVGKDMLSDMGAIYTLGVQPGTVLRNNLIHDVQAFTYGGWGIYPDEGSSEMLIENNIVYRTKSAGFHQHYGRENMVRNNIFAFGREFQMMRSRIEPHLSFTFERNIVYFDQGKLLGTNWNDDKFKLDRNVYWDTRGEIRFAGRTIEEWRSRGQDAASVIADPRFVDAGSYNFALRPDSPALKLGFQPIDMSKVGPRTPAGLQR